MDAALDAELVQAKLSVQEFLKSRHPAWNFVGRVHFNLAENRKDEEAPFEFLATYTTRLSAEAKAQHLPFGKALQDSGARKRQRLLSLLMPVQTMNRRRDRDRFFRYSFIYSARLRGRWSDSRSKASGGERW